MTEQPLTIMLVHAHPDDEVISTGGIALKYQEQGARVVLVTCTRGEEGEIVDPELNTPENKARLAEIRDVELAEALKVLKISDFHQLGYRDSGMINTPANEHPESFNKADLAAATGRLVELVRRYRPQVLISYNEEGGYGHPDHIAAHKITVAAFHAAGDPEQYPEAGEPWAPAKLYYTAWRRSIWRTAWEH
ncbi:MAG TPA: PIG-L family deacetylase, partial [Herpetosiphonaceae bacterium]|nr:PIG-L family deacetylase [Herpetosiphonaceae bacterium]